MNKTISDKDIKLLELLNAHPTLRSRVEALMAVVEDSDGTLEKADAAELRVIEEIRKIGHAALSEWVESKNKRNETELKKTTRITDSRKKNCGGIAPLILSKLKKPYFVRKHRLFVLFQNKQTLPAEVHRRLYNEPSQILGQTSLLAKSMLNSRNIMESKYR